MEVDSFAVDVIWLIIAIIAVIVYLIYRYKIEIPKQKTKKMLKGLYYDPKKFQKKAVSQTFEYYDQKWSKIVFVFFILVVISILGPAALLPQPYSVMVSAMGAAGAFFVVLYYRKDLNTAEIERNVNKPFGTVISHYPEAGDNSELWRRVENKGEILLDDAQREIVVDQMIETAKTLPSYNKKDFDMVKLEKYWKEQIKSFRVFRLLIADEFRILFVSPHSIEDSKTQDTKKMIDETVHVNVQQIPMFALYAGTTRRVFPSKDKKDRNVFIDRTMGIYVNLYDIKSRDDDMTKGGHTVLSKTDVILAEALHLEEQKQASAKEMTKTLRDLEKSEGDYEEADFDAKAEAHRLNKRMKGFMDGLGSYSKESRVSPNSTRLFLIALIVFILGLWIGYNQGIVIGMQQFLNGTG